MVSKRKRRAHYERALRICRRFLGDDHPHTVTVRRNLESLGGSGGGGRKKAAQRKKGPGRKKR